MSPTPNVPHRRATRHPWGGRGGVGNPAFLGRLAWGGLASVLVFLTCFSMFVANSTHGAAERASQSISERDAYEAARYDVVAEQSLERKYRLQPSPAIRAEYAAAASSLVTHLTLAASYANEASDILFIDTTLATHTQYLDAAAHMFDMVDMGETDLANGMGMEEVDALFNSMEDGVNATADALSVKANQQSCSSVQPSRLVNAARHASPGQLRCVP
jgi:hypothetical protein